MSLGLPVAAPTMESTPGNVSSCMSPPPENVHDFLSDASEADTALGVTLMPMELNHMALLPYFILSLSLDMLIDQVIDLGKIWSTMKPGITDGKAGSMLVLVMAQLPVNGSVLTAGFEEDEELAFKKLQPG